MRKGFTDHELEGMTFNLLTVQKIEKLGHHKMAYCSCQCGGYTRTRIHDVLCGHTQSCGCLVGKGKGKHKQIHIPAFTPKVEEPPEVEWNSLRHRFSAVYQGTHLGFFYEEALAEQAVDRFKDSV